MITKLIPKQFRFGNSSTEITEYNSHNFSVKYTPSTARNDYRDSILPETIWFGNHRTGITENNSKIIKFGSVILLCVMVSRDMGHRSDSIAVSRDMGPLIWHSLRGSLLKGGYNNSLHVPLAVPTPAPTPPP